MARKRVKKDFQQMIRTAHQFDSQTLEVAIAEEIGAEGGEAVEVAPHPQLSVTGLRRTREAEDELMITTNPLKVMNYPHCPMN